MIKVFEAFAGYGSQRMALKNLNIPHEVVGISEIEGPVILSYAAIHTNFLTLRNNYHFDKNDEEMYKYLEKINAPLDQKTFINKARKLKKDKLFDMYLANKLCNNFGDISKINPKNLPDFDLFTYSFPCQDISVAGFQKSLSENSGTRSSLLWECCKIIENKKPKYLLMENVKNLIGKKHIQYFKKFLIYLESQGYTNHWKVLDAKDFGIPQRRERIFCVSILNTNTNFEFPETISLEKSLTNYLEKEVSESFYLKNNQFSDKKIIPELSYCLDANYWKGTTLKQYLSKSRRQIVADKLLKNGKYGVRRLTPLETWRLMGCTDEDFQKAKTVNSNTNLYKQAGNSIVVPVLESIFKSLFFNTEPKFSNIKNYLLEKIISTKTTLEASQLLDEIHNHICIKTKNKTIKNKTYQSKLF